MSMRYPISKPFIDQEEIDAVTKVLSSGILSIGPKQKEFEQQFIERFGVSHACAVSSGTSGLHLLLIAAGITAGDEVITSPFSFIASANVIEYVGATPVFCDVDPRTYNIDPTRIEEKITEKTKAILVVHIFGQCADMDPILEIAKRHNLLIIEDACESILATYKGRYAGTFGQGGVFAFYPNKQMTTAEGGMIVTNSEETFDLCDSYKNQGRDNKNMQWLDHRYLGYNYRLSELHCALGVEQFKRLAFFIEERKKIAAWYNERLADVEGITLPYVAPENEMTWFVYTVRLKDKQTRDEMIGRLKKEGVAAKAYLPSIHLFKYYQEKYGYKTGDFPISEEISNTSLALPIYIGLKEEDVEQITQVLRRLIG